MEFEFQLCSSYDNNQSFDDLVKCIGMQNTEYDSMRTNKSVYRSTVAKKISTVQIKHTFDEAKRRTFVHQDMDNGTEHALATVRQGDGARKHTTSKNVESSTESGVAA